MWSFQRSDARNQRLIYTILGCVGFCHLLLMLLIFFMYHEKITTSILISSQRINSPHAIVYRGNSSSSGPTSAQKMRQQPAKSATRKPVTIVQDEKVKKVAKAAPKKTQQTVQKAPAIQQPKKVAQKEIQKKGDPAAKKSEPIKKIEPVAKEAHVPSHEVPPTTAASDMGALPVAAQNSLHLGLLDHYTEEMLYLQQEIATHWHVPLGISAETQCIMTCIVDWQGKVQISIVESSGMPLYDLSARTSLLATEFPRWTWGKSITITFKQ